MPSVEEFRLELKSQFRHAELKNLSHVDISAGELHRRLGGYPGPNHQMPSCCQAMEQERRAPDEIVAGPPSGKGATLIVRYRLPR